MPRLEAGVEVDGGRYRLISRLGSGGMADVWLADDTTLDRKVALKFLHERFAQDKQFVERFKREAQSAGGLQHPNIVGVYDRGEWEGTHYIAMEYVAGASLKDLIEGGLMRRRGGRDHAPDPRGRRARPRPRRGPPRPEARQRSRRP